MQIFINMKSPNNILKTSTPHFNGFFTIHILLFYFLFYLSPLCAQNWVWEKGNNINNHPGVYGNRGVANSNNNPGSRKSAVTWTDTTGNLWLFGGFGCDKNGAIGRLNDLWKYNINTKEWTWIHGQDIIEQPTIYGTKGISNPSNQPGARQEASGIVDTDGNLWLMGGDGFATGSTAGGVNDLWKYNIADNSWVWVSGSNNIGAYGSYGNQGVAASYNIPGSRYSSILGLYNNEIWLMGGFGHALSGANGMLNDVWKYNISTGYWTWMKGQQMTNVQGIYGSQGQAAPTNTPGGRYGHHAWLDSLGNWWVMMGYGYNGIGQYGYLNDVWKYNIAANQWTWIKGANAVHCAANYGTLGLGYNTSTPGARWKSITWVDQHGHFWLFGGYGRSVSAAYGQLNDLWQYNPTSNEWIWMGGNNTIDEKATYGTLNIPTPFNKPGAKEDAFSWVDRDGNLWLMGGYGFSTSTSSGYLNDLWKHIPNQIPSITTPSDTVFCGNTTSFSIPISIEDLDNDSISFSVYGIDPNILNNTISFTHLGGSNYTLNGVFTGNIGSTSCMFLATDEHGASDFTAFEIGIQTNSVSNRNFEICHGDSVFIAGNYQKNTGIYQDILTNYKGCDSIITSTLVVRWQNITYQTADICDGSSYVFGNTTLTTSGLYYDTLLAFNGCDSILILTLIVHPIITTFIYDTIFTPGFYLFGDDSLTTEGRFIDTLIGLNGCDSIVILSLAVIPIMATTTPEPNNTNSLQVYPNPSDGNILVKFKITNSSFYQLSIIDQLGRIVHKDSDQNLPEIEISQDIPLNLSQLSNGIYFVRLQTANGIWIQKIQIVQ